MQGKSERSDSQTVYVGIDVAKDWLDIALYPVGKTFRVANNKKGHKQILTRLDDYDVALVVFEATGKLHRKLQIALHEAGVPAAVVNPCRSRKFADVIGQLAKTDKVDTMMLARFGALHQPPPDTPPREKMLELAELVNARNAAVAEKTTISNRLGAAIGARLKRELKTQLGNQNRHVDRLDKLIRDTINGDHELARRFEILTSIPGIANVTASGLLALLGELGTCTDKQIAALVGVAPMNWDSGKMRGKRAIRGGRASVRRLLYMPAIVAVTGRAANPDFKTVYDRLRQRGKPAKVALVAIMRKLIILANALIAQNREWKPKPA